MLLGHRRNPKLYNKLTAIFRAGYQSPIYVKLIENVSENLAFAMEVFWIASIGRENLCNMTSGGDGTRGLKHSEEHNMKVSAAKKGVRCREETKIKISATKRGVKHTEEHRRNQSAGQTGRKFSAEARNNVSKALAGKKLANNTSGYAGVFKTRYGWIARLQIKKAGRFNLGTYPTRESAAFAYNRKALELFGQSARLNTIPYHPYSLAVYQP